MNAWVQFLGKSTPRLVNWLAARAGYQHELEEWNATLMDGLGNKELLDGSTSEADNASSGGWWDKGRRSRAGPEA